MKLKNDIINKLNPKLILIVLLVCCILSMTINIYFNNIYSPLVSLVNGSFYMFVYATLILIGKKLNIKILNTLLLVQLVVIFILSVISTLNGKIWIDSGFFLPVESSLVYIALVVLMLINITSIITKKAIPYKTLLLLYTLTISLLIFESIILNKVFKWYSVMNSIFFLPLSIYLYQYGSNINRKKENNE
ncbi:MAG: hypothetical protein PHR25_05525 [Clostridia bacterium]|nr:hypothetical protein [Clostridia bacterium]